MNIKTHQINKVNIAEVISDEIILANLSDGLDLLGNLYFDGYDKIIIYETNISPDFFDLKTGIAGEILQKFSNYRVQLAIVGDFGKYQNQSFKDFVFESNKLGQINFVGTITEALKINIL
jgi:Domain of unknown function (DUF4180)